MFGALESAFSENNTRTKNTDGVLVIAQACQGLVELARQLVGSDEGGVVLAITKGAGLIASQQRHGLSMHR